MIRPGWLLLALACFGLAACGKVGTLDQPAPLYGEKAKAKYEADKEAAAAARATKNDGGPDTVTPDKDPNPYADPGPQRDQPIAGQNPSFNGTPPPGVLPDPFARPQ